MKIAFLGIGFMGLSMSRRLCEAGHAVHVWNRSRDKAERASAFGATVHDTAAQAAAQAEAWAGVRMAEPQALWAVVSVAVARGAVVSVAVARRQDCQQPVELQRALRDPRVVPDQLLRHPWLSVAAGTTRHRKTVRVDRQQSS